MFKNIVVVSDCHHFSVESVNQTLKIKRQAELFPTYYLQV